MDFMVNPYNFNDMWNKVLCTETCEMYSAKAELRGKCTVLDSLFKLNVYS